MTPLAHAAQGGLLKALAIALVAAALSSCLAPVPKQLRLAEEQADCMMAAWQDDRLSVTQRKFLVAGCHDVYLMKGGRDQ
jgi:hypothetical protein